MSTPAKVTRSPARAGSSAPGTPAEPKRRLPLRRIAARLQAHLRHRKAGALKFGVAGHHLDEAIALGLPLEQDITLPDGRVVRVHDQYAESNQAGGYKVFERFKVEEVDPAREARRASRRAAAPAGKEAPGA